MPYTRLLRNNTHTGGLSLYAGGGFSEPGPQGIHFIARWNGVDWVQLDTGGFNELNGAVYALKVFDDGAGAALYAAGEFTNASGSTVNRIAKWNGVEWSALETGLDGTAFSLAVFNDGSGNALYVGGAFKGRG